MNIPLNIDWQQILLHLLNFAILAGGLYLLLYKPVKAFLAKRERFYQDQADQAEKTRQEAEDQVKELVSAAAEKLVLSSDGAVFDQFLALTGKGEDGDES